MVRILKRNPFGPSAYCLRRLILSEDQIFGRCLHRNSTGIGLVKSRARRYFMKVLHILNELKHSGAEVMLQQAFERFSQHGIESHLLSTGQQVGDYTAVLEKTGFKI